MEICLTGTENWAHGQTLTFDFLRNGRPAQGFVIRHHDSFFAYLNQCCHWPVPLDLGDKDFYYPAGDRIMCKTHGAVYQPDTGLCDYGPCVRAVLESFPIEMRQDLLVVTVPD